MRIIDLSNMFDQTIPYKTHQIENFLGIPPFSKKDERRRNGKNKVFCKNFLFCFDKSAMLLEQHMLIKQLALRILLSLQISLLNFPFCLLCSPYTIADFYFVVASDHLSTLDNSSLSLWVCNTYYYSTYLLGKIIE